MTIEEVWKETKRAWNYKCDPDRADKAAIAVLRQHLVPRTDGDDGELVARLNYTHEHGIFDAQVAGMLASPKEAADRITALSAEVERLRAVLGAVRGSSLRRARQQACYAKF
jgi:uncharacterized small protein (DUF1192 family)